MSGPGRAAACAVVLGVIVVGCGSGSIHGRSAADSSGVVALSRSAPASSLAASSVSPPASASTAPPSSSAPTLDASAGTTAALAKDHWSTLPPAPIAVRTSAASAWTGRQLLIWGGAYGPQGDQLAGDGAAYDPTTKRWAKLPAAPISARTQMASVWTGSELFVWGGDASDGISNDGALYNPTTTTWRKLPASPLSGRVDPQAVWVDGEVIVISGDPPAQSSTPQVYTDLAAFSPTTNRWTKLAPMPLNANQLVLVVVAVATNDRLYAWEEWQHTTDDGGGASSTYSGLDLYVFDPTRNTWTPDVAASRPTDGRADDNSPGGVDSALWTGTNILVPPATSNWCGDCPGPAILGGRGDLLNPSTNTWTKIPAGPIDDFDPGVFVWTGSTVIDFNTSSETNGPDGSTFPGQAAAWDPVSGTWTRLPAAPLYGGDVNVWDGDELLEWGMLDVPTSNESVPSDTTGVQFGPDP
jgi:N-acetylneuraminic acid mutarotase